MIVSDRRFFFGANTPQGFRGFHQTDLYDPRDGWVAFLIKSGAGTGKATFMRRVLEDLTARGIEAETVYCSSDPDSLDAVIFPTIKLCVIDATAPHVLEPLAYGECEQLVPFGCCLQADKTLSQTTAWFEAADACQASHARCCRFLAAAGSLLTNNRLLAQSALNTAKITAAAMRLAQKESTTSTIPHETRRFLSAVTPQGYIFFGDTAAAMCPKLYVIEDEYGAVSQIFMTVLRAALLDAKQHIVSCFTPFSQEIPAHILLPSCGIGFVTSNSRETVEFPVYRRIHAARFVDNDILRGKKQQMRFNRRAATDMLHEAILCASDAKTHHDRMEALHTTTMDWDLWERIAAGTMAHIHAIADARM